MTELFVLVLILIALAVMIVGILVGATELVSIIVKSIKQSKKDKMEESCCDCAYLSYDKDGVVTCAPCELFGLCNPKTKRYYTPKND